MRARYGAILALALALPAALFAAPPVDVPKEVTGDVGAFVAVRGKTDGATVRFVALDPGLNLFPADLLADKKATVVSAAKPGRYRLLAYSSVRDDPTEPAVVTVVIGGAPQPDPKPDPGPSPQPDPQPAPVKADAVFVVVVEDATAARAIDTAKALNDPYWGTLRPRHDYRHYRSDSAAARASGYVKEAESVGYPAVLLLDQKDGEVLKKFKLSGGSCAPIQDAVKEVTK